MQLNNKIETCPRKEEIWNGITLTDSAAHQILRLSEHNPDMLGLRLNVKKSGCAGFSYLLDKVTCAEEGDLIYENCGAKLYVPPKAMPFIDGTKLDYVQENLNYVFKFYNPNVQNSCGCGESFSL